MHKSLTDKDVKCRKGHVCEWCGGDINKGETARYRTGVMDNRIVSGYEHIECYIAMVHSDPSDFYDGEFMPHEQKYGKTMAESHN